MAMTTASVQGLPLLVVSFVENPSKATARGFCFLALLHQYLAASLVTTLPVSLLALLRAV